MPRQNCEQKKSQDPSRKNMRKMSRTNVVCKILKDVCYLKSFVISSSVCIFNWLCAEVWQHLHFYLLFSFFAHLKINSLITLLYTDKICEINWMLHILHISFVYILFIKLKIKNMLITIYYFIFFNLFTKPYFSVLIYNVIYILYISVSKYFESCYPYNIKFNWRKEFYVNLYKIVTHIADLHEKLVFLHSAKWRSHL